MDGDLEVESDLRRAAKEERGEMEHSRREIDLVECSRSVCF